MSCAIIGKKAAFFLGNLHTWTKSSVTIKNIKINNIDTKVLTIIYEYWDRFGANSYSLQIPIPIDNEIDTNKLLTMLKKS